MESISLTEARAKLGEIASQVRFGGGSVVLTKNGENIAVIVPFQDYEVLQLAKLKEARSYRALREALSPAYRDMSEEEVADMIDQIRQEIWDEKQGKRLAEGLV